MHRLIAVGSLVACVASLPAGAGSAGEGGAGLCRGAQLDLSVGQEMSAATGQNPFSLHLTNRSRQSCVLSGYPSVSFGDRGGPVPLVARHGGGHGGDQQVTLQPPRRVLVRPGRTAYVILNKYRCDLGTLRLADTMRVALPAGSAVGSVGLRSLAPGTRSYCKRVSAFNVVSVSPFVPSIAAGLRRY